MTCAPWPSADHLSAHDSKVSQLAPNALFGPVRSGVHGTRLTQWKVTFSELGMGHGVAGFHAGGMFFLALLSFSIAFQLRFFFFFFSFFSLPRPRSHGHRLLIWRRAGVYVALVSTREWRRQEESPTRAWSILFFASSRRVASGTSSRTQKASCFLHGAGGEARAA